MSFNENSSRSLFSLFVHKNRPQQWLERIFALAGFSYRFKAVIFIIRRSEAKILFSFLIPQVKISRHTPETFVFLRDMGIPTNRVSFCEYSTLLAKFGAFLRGRGQNMDPGSMDPPFGPGPWTTYMDPVHRPGPWTPYFSNLEKKNKIKNKAIRMQRYVRSTSCTSCSPTLYV